MNKINNGGPAFPQPLTTGTDGYVYDTMEVTGGKLGGISTLDYFAKGAMEHLMSAYSMGIIGKTALAETSYDIAEAMLRERG